MNQGFLFLNCLEHLYLTVDGRNVLHFTKCFAFYMQVFVFPKVFFAYLLMILYIILLTKFMQA